jgi:hypothetical protein
MPLSHGRRHEFSAIAVTIAGSTRAAARHQADLKAFPLWLYGASVIAAHRPERRA